MIGSIKKNSFLQLVFVNIALFFGFLHALDEGETLLKDQKEESFQDYKIPYEIIDISMMNFSKLSFQNGFGLNAGGNILFSDTERMFSDDSDNVSIQYFQDYKIPKIHFQSAYLADIAEFSIKYLSVQIPKIIPTINKEFKDLMGECKNSMCIFTANSIEKKYIKGIGGSNEEEVGLMIIPDILRLDSESYPTLSYKTLDADIITAIGGIGKYAAGIRSKGIVNVNKLIAIGGIQNGAIGFLNEYFLNVGNLIAIGGRGLGVNGLNNSSSDAFLKANNIIAIGGTQAYSYGVYNAGKIETNFLTAIGGENLNAVGFYNKQSIEADVVIALATQNNSGVAIFNEGQIDTKSLVVIGGSDHYSLINDENNINKSKINAESIYLRGKNAIYNHDNASIITSNLVISDFSSIQGNIIFDASKTSLLSFDIRGQRWNNTLPFFGIKNGNLTLNPNTKIEATFSSEWILSNNLSYDKTYHLLSITGKGELIDNRIQKNIDFLGLSMTPQIKIDKKGIMFAFIKEGGSNPPMPISPNPEKDEIKDKIDSLAIPISEEKIIQKLTSISNQAPSILRSIIEANNNGVKFQEIAIDEGLKNFASDPKLLTSLIEKTDEMLRNSSISAANSSQKTSQYITQKVTDRINNLMFKRNFRASNFTALVHKWALASNDDQIYMPKFNTENSVWANIGGSYYHNSSASLNSFSIASINSSIGYDRGIDVGRDIDFILGGLFNYSKSFYYQKNGQQNLDIFTIGIYSNTIIGKHEIQSTISTSELFGNAKIHNEEIGISEESYANNNFAFNIEGFYKYKLILTDKHSIKPLVLANYSFLYTPSSSSKTFSSKNLYDQIFALGTGGEYHFENSFMKHIFQLTGRYHIKDITKTRPISFKGAQTFINYDLVPSRIWMKLSYGAKFLLPSGFDLDVSISSDVSTSGDFLGMGNLGVSYIW